MSSKPTFTIGELASQSGLTPDALRYYEKLGIIACGAVVLLAAPIRFWWAWRHPKFKPQVRRS